MKPKTCIHCGYKIALFNKSGVCGECQNSPVYRKVVYALTKKKQKQLITIKTNHKKCEYCKVGLATTYNSRKKLCYYCFEQSKYKNTSVSLWLKNAGTFKRC